MSLYLTPTPEREDKEEYAYAEERRLLYVGLTRTRNNVYLLSPEYDRSIFIKELVENYDISPIEFDVDERLEENFTRIEITPEQLENFNKKLNEAKIFKRRRSYYKAFKLFDECYKTYPEKFKYIDKEDYAWMIYYVYVNRIRNEKDFFNSVNFIIDLTEQRNLRKLDQSCVYTSAIFKVLNHLTYIRQYDKMFVWLDKLDPKLLNPFSKKKYKSKKELYYNYLSNAYYNTGQYEKCIEISKYALKNLDYLVGEEWFRLRIDKSLNEL